MTLLFKRARSLDPSTSHAAADQAQDLARQHFDLIVGCLQRFGARGKDGIAELTGQVTKSKSGRSEREWRFVPVQRELI